MIPKALVEFIGTFIFLSVILSNGQAIPIAITLAAMIYFATTVSALGHFNPAVSIMMYAKGGIHFGALIFYIAAQVLAGLAALAYYKATMKK